MKNSFPNLKKVLLYVFFLSYIALLIKLILFKEITGELRNISLIPFKATLDYFADQGASFGLAVWNIIGNIVLFIPLGIYLKIFKAWKLLDYLKVFILISLSFEILQFIFGLGTSDIDDVIYNVIGGILGVFVFEGLTLSLKSEERAKWIVITLGIIATVLLTFILTRFQVRI